MGGGVLSTLFLWLGWFMFSGTQNPSIIDRLAAIFFWFLFPMLWSGSLAAVGYRMVQPR